MGVDAIITAGDGRAARKVFKKNKSLLDIGGKPIIRHIVETLLTCDQIDQIVVVGPKDRFEEVLGDLPVHLVEQRRNLTENAWEGFLQTIPAYRDTGVLSREIIESNRHKYALCLSGDIPLITGGELQEFIGQCDMERFDYVAGSTSEEVLKLFGPRKGRPGIKMATFHTRDGNFRQNNLHMGRPFVFLDSLDLILKVYEYRYQKELVNIAKALGEILRLGPGRIGKTLGLYLLLQVSAGLSALGLEFLARLACYPVTIARVEETITGILGGRTKVVQTRTGGAALDVDNEKDFLTLSIMYRDWLNQIREANHHLA